MKLGSRLLLLACFAILLQLLILGGLFYYLINPKIAKLEKSLVEKNLHRGLGLIQRELFHLEQLTRIIAQTPLMGQILNDHDESATAELKAKMIANDFTVIYILNLQHKVMWEETLDASMEQPYPKQNILTSIWEKKPGFLDNASPMISQSGFYPTKLGPMLVVSSPISSKNSQVFGTLIVGRLVTQEVVQLLQSLAFTEFKLWPLGEERLNQKQREIVGRLLENDQDFIIDDAGRKLFRGYIALQDINHEPNLLMASTLSRDFTQVLNSGMVEIAVALFLFQIFFLAVLALFIRKTVLLPTKNLTQQINHTKGTWTPDLLHLPPTHELGILTNAISQFMSRFEVRLSQETTFAYREGVNQTRHQLYQDVEETLRPLIKGIELTEKKLSDLPTNEIEWIIAKARAGQISPDDLLEFAQKLQVINERLRQYQRETRHRLYELHSKALRNAAQLRVQSRSLDPIRQFTPVPSPARKEKLEP